MSAKHTPGPKLSDMGTTGLIDYVLAQSIGRRRALACANASRVLARRYPRCNQWGFNESVIRFRRAVQATEAARWAR